METHEHFMRQALNMARQGLDRGELPIGAIVVLDDRIIAAAHTMKSLKGVCWFTLIFLRWRPLIESSPFQASDATQNFMLRANPA